MAKSWNQGADKFSRSAKKNIKVKRSRDDWEADEDDDFRTQRNTDKVASEATEPARSVDPFAETALLDPVEPIELDKRLPFFEHLYGMNMLRNQWNRFWRGL